MMIWLVNPNYDFPPHPTDRSQAKKSGSNQGLFEGEGHGQIEIHREKIVNCKLECRLYYRVVAFRTKAVLKPEILEFRKPSQKK